MAQREFRKITNTLGAKSFSWVFFLIFHIKVLAWQPRDSSRSRCQVNILSFPASHLVIQQSLFVINFITFVKAKAPVKFQPALSGRRCISFWICDKYRWGNKTRRNGADIKMFFVLADKLPCHPEFCKKNGSFLSKWRVMWLSVCYFTDIRIFVTLIHSSAKCAAICVYTFFLTWLRSS